MEVGTQILMVEKPPVVAPEITDEQAMIALLMDVGAVATEKELGVTFDALSQIAAEQPDNEQAINDIRQLVVEAGNRGFIDAAAQMVMTLGAMACMHPQLESVANELGELYGGMEANSDHGHDHDAPEDEHEAHDTETCENCKAGKPCSRK